MEGINWVLWLVAAAGGVVVGCAVYLWGAWMDGRRAAAADRAMDNQDAQLYLAHPPRTLEDELCAIQAEEDDERG